MTPTVEESIDHLPIDVRCVHDNWKVRISGYSAATELFKSDEAKCDSDTIWNRYVPIIRTFVVDTNAPALEKALEAVVAFVQNYNDAGKTVCHIMPDLILKGVASSRARTRDLAVEICLSFVEIGKHEAVLEELIKGTNSKNPKIPATCLYAITEIIRAFGPEIFDISCLLDKIPVLLEYRDSKVRNGAKLLAAELYRWLGPAITNRLTNLKPYLIDEIVETARNFPTTPLPTRTLKSQQQKIVKDTKLEQNYSTNAITRENQLATDNSKSVNVLMQVPKEFFSLMRSHKWTERRDALQSLEQILSCACKIENGDFNELIKTLTNAISKDANIIVVSQAINCVRYLANGLRSKFSSYSLLVLRVLLEKLKEKKQSVVECLRDALDAVFKSTSFDQILNELIENLNNKNPNVKCETALFLSRCFVKSTSANLNKKQLKPLISALVLLLANSDPKVRDCSVVALGEAVKITGSDFLNPFLVDLDQQKVSKVLKYSQLTSEKSLEAVNNKPAVQKNMKSNSSTPCRLPSSTNQCKDTNTRARQIHKKANEHEGKGIILSTDYQKANSVVRNSKIQENIKYKLTQELQVSLENKAWEARLQAMADLKTMVDSLEDVTPFAGELAMLLSPRISDKNSKISTIALNLLMDLIGKMRQKFKQLVPCILIPLLKSSGNPNVQIREKAVDCLTLLADSCSFKELFDNERIPEFLISGPLTAKIRIWKWISEKFHTFSITTANKDCLVNCLPSIFVSLEDRNVDIRKYSCKALDGFLNVLGSDLVLSVSNRTVGSWQNDKLAKLILNRSRAININSGRINEAQIMTTKEERSEVLEKHKVISVKTSEINDEEKDCVLSDFNQTNNEKLSAGPAQPRNEFFQILKNLMVKAKFKTELIHFLFHSDCEFQIKATDLLLKELKANPLEITSSFDLILRWVSLRLFDAQISVLHKILDFMLVSLEHLRKLNYCLLDNEASAIVPCLVLKLGDRRDDISTKVKAVLLKMGCLYPIDKLQKYLLEGTRSSSPQQKATCLDVFRTFIDSYGESVYADNVDKITEIVAKLFEDEDAKVRAAAFDVAALLLNGEGGKLLNLIEKAGNKNQSEIFNRTSTNAAAKQSFNTNFSLEAEDPYIKQNNIIQPSFENSIDNKKKIQYAGGQGLRQSESSNNKFVRFSFDQNLVKELDDIANFNIFPIELVTPDLEFLKLEDKQVKSTLTPQSCKLLYASKPSNISKTLQDIVNDDISVSINSLKEVETFLSSENSNYLLGFTDCLVTNTVLKLKNLTEHHSDDLRWYGSIFVVLLKLCSSKEFTERFSDKNLYQLIHRILLFISYGTFNENESYKSVANNIILQILTNSRKTQLMCCLLQMMGDTKDETQVANKHHELCIKCLWKLNRAQPSWDEELDYLKVIQTIQNILQHYPSQWWKPKAGDVAVRTAKTILRTMIKLRGERVFTDLKKEPSFNETSDLYIYLEKLAKCINFEGKRKSSTSCQKANRQPNVCLPKSVARELAGIFHKMAIDPLKGVHLLTAFKSSHTEIDLPLVISEKSPEMLKYLQEMNDSWTGDGVGMNDRINIQSGAADPNLTADDIFSEEAERLWMNLKRLKTKVGLETTCDAN